MNILFLHRNFPGQFKHIVQELAKNKNNNIYFITNNHTIEIDGIKKLVYEIPSNASINSNDYLYYAQDAIEHGKASAQLATQLKESGFIPDLIYGHSWGNTMFMKDVFPDTPIINYFEWFYNDKNTDFDFGRTQITFEEKAKLRCKNFSILTDLCSCNAGIAPTHWQKCQFPKEFQDKIKVIHDGIDTDLCKPDPNAKFSIKNKNIELTNKDKVITYATRGMEDYRGFPQFMIAAKQLIAKHSDAHIVIAGENNVFYGRKLIDTTYKDLMIKELNIDLSRIHFVGKLPFDDYIKLLQISSVHVYLTYPYVLSWSILEAMACGCCIVASDTKPVLEVIKDNNNGLLCNFFNINQLVEKIEYALNNHIKMNNLRTNARNTILQEYAINKLLPAQISYINSFLQY